MQKAHQAVIDNILASRGKLPHGAIQQDKPAEEGGCGVTGFIASIPVRGRYIHEPSVQMHNRGNGKGGGIAAVGLSAEDLGVSQEVLDSHYLLQVALLDPSVRKDVEANCITPVLDVHKSEKIPTLDYRRVEGLEVRPPDVWRYFVRVKKEALEKFAEDNNLQDMDPAKLEDEFIYQNSFKLNQKYYASLGDQKAFVLSHGKNLMILKIVGYAEKVVEYYKLDDFRAHGWIAHQRYPTKGRVWHPGGAHPFIGLNEALVHNGDFANYHAVCEFLKQHNIYPQFLTDTEVSVLMLDLMNRTFEYPMEYIIEALAPTSEYDFDMLPVDKQKIYRYIQSGHISGSPDGPWFFIIARNDPYNNFFQLLGITDTAMLRPQVFALHDGEVQIGLICSEKQAIDATLYNLSKEDNRICPVADKYWNARGGSASDGGTFMFTVKDSGKGDGSKELVCTNKFGEKVAVSKGKKHDPNPLKVNDGPLAPELIKMFDEGIAASDSGRFIRNLMNALGKIDYDQVKLLCKKFEAAADDDDTAKARAISVLTRLNDMPYPTGDKKRAGILHILQHTLTSIFKSTPKIRENGPGAYRYIDWDNKDKVRAPENDEKVLVINARQFPPEGEQCDARTICAAYKKGWMQFICFGYKGQRFTGCGLGPETNGVRIDVYDSSGDYLASGIDGMEIYVHGNAQDQLGQIMKRGKLVVFGDVGQTFMYGAKGGDVYIMGNAAGRPLINAVGRPKVVINGTCLDYLAESFMAGDALAGGGFVILNGVTLTEDGQVVDQPTPYPGSNLFSLASGGAIYVRDPERQLVDEQLNGAEYVELGEKDWKLILPYLQENEKQFGISVNEDLLTVNGEKKEYNQVYRKVQPVKSDVLAKQSAGVEEWGEDWQSEPNLIRAAS